MDETVYAFKTEWKPGGEVRVFLSKQKERLENFEPKSHELKRFETTEKIRKWTIEGFKAIDESFEPTRRTYYYIGYANPDDVGEREENVKIVDHVHGAQYIESMIGRND